jgi:hypothetical protein
MATNPRLALREIDKKEEACDIIELAIHELDLLKRVFNLISTDIETEISETEDNLEDMVH